jgi:hypothetical protein
MLYCFIDNGSTGFIAILNENGSILHFSKVPVSKVLLYTKTRQTFNLVASNELKSIIASTISKSKDKTIQIALERPAINPRRGTNSIKYSFANWLVVDQLISVEMGLFCETVDSKKWQSKMLPTHNTGETKKVAKQIVQRVFPGISVKIPSGGEDALLGAEWLRRRARGDFK